MSSSILPNAALPSQFAAASAPVAARHSRKAPKTQPFSIRFTDDERAFLEERAGNQPLGAYIRNILLEEHTHKRRAIRKPHIEQTQYASLLAALGESRLSSNLNQLARHANVGTLDVRDDLEQQLEDACGAIQIMRENLLIALGLKTRGGQ